MGTSIHLQGKARAIESSRAVAFAVVEFAKTHGEPPEDLHQLVPAFLPTLPFTHVGRFQEYGYVVNPEREAQYGSSWTIFLEAGSRAETITISALGADWEGAPGEDPFHLTLSADFPRYGYIKGVGPVMEPYRFPRIEQSN